MRDDIRNYPFNVPSKSECSTPKFNVLTIVFRGDKESERRENRVGGKMGRYPISIGKRPKSHDKRRRNHVHL